MGCVCRLSITKLLTYLLIRINSDDFSERWAEQLEMKDQFNQILIKYRPQLVDKMDCTEVLNLLLSKNVLTRRQVKSIQVNMLCTFEL